MDDLLDTSCGILWERQILLLELSTTSTNSRVTSIISPIRILHTNEHQTQHTRTPMARVSTSGYLVQAWEQYCTGAGGGWVLPVVGNIC